MLYIQVLFFFLLLFFVVVIVVVVFVLFCFVFLTRHCLIQENLRFLIAGHTGASTRNIVLLHGNTVNLLHTDIQYNDKIHYSDK